MRLLVCGSRTWSYPSIVAEHIHALRPTVVIHGAATGADTLAWQYAHSCGLMVLSFPANWGRDGNAAGPIRNAAMMTQGHPDRGLAFGPLWKQASIGPRAWPNNESWKHTGTGDMVSKMLRAALPVRWVASPEAVAVDLTEMPEAWKG